MGSMMKAFELADTENSIALPQMLESTSALTGKPVDFIRILETGGTICRNTL